MFDQLLTAKLYIPPVRERRVGRPRLLQRLGEGLGQIARQPHTRADNPFASTQTNVQRQIDAFARVWRRSRTRAQATNRMS